MTLAKRVSDIQSACNPVAVVNHFAEIVQELMEKHGRNMTAVRNDPAFILIADKVFDMAGRPDGADYAKHWDALIARDAGC